MSSSDTTVITTSLESPEPSPSSPPAKFPFLSLLSKFNIGFPPKKRAGKAVKSGEDEPGLANSGNREGSMTSLEKKTDFVRFRLREPAALVEPLKFEADESEHNSNPRVLWQVYALGGFMIMRWAWVKWQERKADNSKGTSGDGNSSENN